MPEDQAKALLEAVQIMNAMWESLNAARMVLQDNTPENIEGKEADDFFFGLRALLNTAHSEMSRMLGGLGEALSRANPPRSAMN